MKQRNICNKGEDECVWFIKERGKLCVAIADVSSTADIPEKQPLHSV